MDIESHMLTSTLSGLPKGCNMHSEFVDAGEKLCWSLKGHFSQGYV